MKCEDCKFYYIFQNTAYITNHYCRRFPPKDEAFRFPRVDPVADWCGEFKEKDASEIKQKSRK